MPHIIDSYRYPNNEIRTIHWYRADRRKNPARAVLLWAQFIILLCASDDGSECKTPPPLILDISSDLAQSGYGKMGKRTIFGISARRTILRAGGALDRLDSKPYHYTMLTGTLPGSTPESYKAMAEWSGWIVHELARWIGRYAKGAHWFYAWELQSRGALHIHWCIHLPDTYTRCFILHTFWDEWRSIIDTVSEKSGIDMWAKSEVYSHKANKSVLQADAQQCYRSVAAYVSKYTSKKEGKAERDVLAPYYPVRWWGMARSTTTLLKGLTEKVSSEYSSYRDAKKEMTSTLMKVKDVTDIAHTYAHSVGVGSTIVSYHPQDQGQALWESLTTNTISPALFPNASSWIASVEWYLLQIQHYLRASKKCSVQDWQHLSKQLEDSTWLGSLSRYTLHQNHLKLLLRCNAVCSLHFLGEHTEASTLNRFIEPIWMYHQIQTHLVWNAQGWLNLSRDFTVRLTNCWVADNVGTNDDHTSDAHMAETANGSMSPQVSAIQLSLL